MEGTIVITECRGTINDKDKKDHKIEQRKQNNRREGGGKYFFIRKQSIIQAWWLIGSSYLKV